MSVSMGFSDLEGALGHCCGSRQWLQWMLSESPFTDLTALLQASRRTCDKMKAEDWLEAFDAHPMIGDIKSLASRFAATKDLASAEQAAVGQAEAAVIAELAHWNQLYRSKFGFIFIIAAEGKSAEEMLAALQLRINNSYIEELYQAAQQQSVITEKRLIGMWKRCSL